ncbi:MAG: hypothetical protein RR847_05060 [Bacilli bacterium]
MEYLLNNVNTIMPIIILSYLPGYLFFTLINYFNKNKQENIIIIIAVSFLFTELSIFVGKYIPCIKVDENIYMYLYPYVLAIAFGLLYNILIKKNNFINTICDKLFRQTNSNILNDLIDLNVGAYIEIRFSTSNAIIYGSVDHMDLPEFISVINFKVFNRDNTDNFSRGDLINIEEHVSDNSLVIPIKNIESMLIVNPNKEGEFMYENLAKNLKENIEILHNTFEMNNIQILNVGVKEYDENDADCTILVEMSSINGIDIPNDFYIKINLYDENGEIYLSESCFNFKENFSGYDTVKIDCFDDKKTLTKAASGRLFLVKE